MGDPFIQQMADLVKAMPTANKWIVIPHQELGWMLGERLVLEGCNWVNLRFITPFQLALEGAAPDLLAEGFNPCPEGLGPSLVHHLLTCLPQHPLAGLVDQPGVTEALWNTLFECRMAGVSLGALDRAYQSYLDQHRLADRSMILARRANAKVAPNDVVVLYPYCTWSPLEREYVQRLPGQLVLGAASALEAPRRWQGWRHPTPVSEATQNEFFTAGRRDLEFQEVLRRIDRPYDQVEMVAHSQDLPLLADMLVQYSCPATFAQGLPIRLSRPGKALLGFMRWLEEGTPGFLLRELLMANLIKAVPNSWTAARLIKAARIGWGRADYRPRLEALARRSETHAKLHHQKVQARQVLDWVNAIFEQFPQSNTQSVPIQRWLNSLQKTASEQLDVDPEATPMLLSTLEELKRLPGEEMPLFRLLDCIRARLEKLLWNPRRPAPGHLHVTDLTHMGLSGRSTVFITGQEEGRESTMAIPDCILSDDERSALHPDLALSSDHMEEYRFAIQERLVSLSGRIIWSFALRDREGDQETLPSWRFFEAARKSHPQLKTVEDLLDCLGEPAQPWSMEESSDYVGTPVHVLAAYPDLARGQVAEDNRASPDFTVYDGLVPAAAGHWNPRSPATALSVSRLQSLAACPFSYFLTQGLGLYPQPLPLPDPDQWFDPAERGHILHELFRRYGEARRHQEIFHDEQNLDEVLAQQLPAPSAGVAARERENLLLHLRHFLYLESLRPDHIPLGLEVSFGLGEVDQELSRAQPVELELGQNMRIRIQGRIDRIDQTPDGYRVIDFKTGHNWKEAGNAGYNQGRHLQHDLYALVAEQLLDTTEVRSQYTFTHPHATHPWQEFPPPDRVALRQVLELILHPLVDGAFVHSHQSQNDCRFCDFRAACLSHQDAQVKRKLNDPQLLKRRELTQDP